jgi:hypothetical protein
MCVIRIVSARSYSKPQSHQLGINVTVCGLIQISTADPLNHECSCNISQFENPPLYKYKLLTPCDHPTFQQSKNIFVTALD